MNIYRLNSKEDTDNSNKKYVYVLENNSNNYCFNCPFCTVRIDPHNYSVCSENNKYYEGILFWKKYCNINNVHEHYTCEKCKMQWIIKKSDYSKLNRIDK